MKKITIRYFKSIFLGVTAGFLVTSSAFATNGMRVIGIGPVQRSMGGASVAMPLDGATTISNPAGMALLDSQVNFGASMFTPTASIDKVEYTPIYLGPNMTAAMGTSVLPAPGTDYSKTKESEVGTSPMPAFGMILPAGGDDMRIGIGGYGVAGMGVDYKGAAIYDQNAYSNYQMMKFAPAFSMKMGDLAIGAALNIDWATMGFAANGLQSANNNSQFGYGFTLGAIYVLGDLNIGLAYESKQDFSNFKFNGKGCSDGYSLKSSDGKCYNMMEAIKTDNPATMGTGVDPDFIDGEVALDQPPVITLGFGYTLGDLKIALDVSQIKWSETVGADSPESNYDNYAFDMNWKDQMVYKLGIQYAVDPKLQVRAGYNYGEDPTDHDKAFETLMFPAIVETHYTLGASYQVGERVRLDFGYMEVAKNSVEGSNATDYMISSYETSLAESSIEMGVTANF